MRTALSGEPLRGAPGFPARAVAAVLAVAALLGLAPRPGPAPLRAPSPPPTEPLHPLDLPPVEPWLPLSLRAPSRLGALPPLHIRNINTLEEAEVRLHDDLGALDEEAAAQLDRLLADGRRPGQPHVVAPIDRRLLRLVFRVAHHFGAREVEVISGYRQPRRYAEGLHGKARAVDFRLAGVEAPDVAAYARGLPRVGVGLYTHPRTRWVHLDVRDRSYHWVDGTGPGRRWGAVRLPTEQRRLDEQDASDEGDDPGDDPAEPPPSP